MTYVFDTSFVGALVIPDEYDPLVSKMYGEIKGDDIKYVPQLFWYEISNVFHKLLRRKRYSLDDILEFYPSLKAIRLTIDDESGELYSEKLLRLCHEYDLSSYDAAYLELAKRKSAVLCTLDYKLHEAAKKHGVIVKH